jgi:F-type H+-transporting ATPase subunit delta
MVEDRIGYRYAKSLFDLAKEKQILEDVREDMALIHQVCIENRDFLVMLKSPLINGDKKLKVLRSIFSKKFTSDFTQLLMDIIVKKGREKFLDYVAKSFLQLYDIEKHIQRGKLISAKPLSNEQVEQIKAEVAKETGDTFELEMEVDPSLIGGFVLKIGDKLFDGSIATSLRQLKQDFRKNTYIKQF